MRRKGGSAGAFTATTQRVCSSSAGDRGNKRSRMPLFAESEQNRRSECHNRCRNSASAPFHILAPRRPVTGSASASDGCSLPGKERDPTTFPSPSGSCCQDRQATHPLISPEDVHICPRVRSRKSDASKPWNVRGVLPPDSTREHPPRGSHGAVDRLDRSLRRTQAQLGQVGIYAHIWFHMSPNTQTACQSTPHSSTTTGKICL